MINLRGQLHVLRHWIVSANTSTWLFSKRMKSSASSWGHGGDRDAGPPSQPAGDSHTGSCCVQCGIGLVSTALGIDGIAFQGTWHTASGAEHTLPSPREVGGSYQISMMPVFFSKASASRATPLAVIWFWISLEEGCVVGVRHTAPDQPCPLCRGT